jgi:hypothetical protein
MGVDMKTLVRMVVGVDGSVRMCVHMFVRVCPERTPQAPDTVHQAEGNKDPGCEIAADRFPMTTDPVTWPIPENTVTRTVFVLDHLPAFAMAIKGT